MRPITMTVRWLVVVWALLAAGIGSAQEAEVAARVTAVSGKVTAANRAGAIRTLQQGAAVYAGETISTGPGSRVRLAFTDGGAKTLRPESRLAIDEYRYRGEPAQDSSVLRLVRGGMRALTGAIGAANRERYRVGTAVSTIGIRGTEYLVRFCQRDCNDLQPLGVEPPRDGLYTHTVKGTITVGRLELPAGRSSHTSMERVTAPLTVIPPILGKDPHLGAESALPGTAAVLEVAFDIPAQTIGVRALVCD